jgi:hypothetical protein
VKMNGQHSTWELEPSQENVQQLQQIVQELQLVHDPRTSNEHRLQAQSVNLPFHDLNF